MRRSSAVDYALLGVVVIALSSSGPIVAYATAPALVMAFWRCVIATTVTLPFTLGSWGLVNRHLLSRSTWAGFFLAMHLGLWMASIRMTSVAASTALVATQPIWTAVLERASGKTIPVRAWIGSLIAIGGVALVVGLDFSADSRALIGDAMALGGAVAIAAYVAIGGEVRQQLPTATYTVILYVTTGMVLLIGAVLWRQPVVGFGWDQWLLIGALTLGPHLLGHSLLNRLVRTMPPLVIGVGLLLEAPGAAIGAAWLVGQAVGVGTILAIGVILIGLVMVAMAGERMEVE